MKKINTDGLIECLDYLKRVDESKFNFQNFVTSFDKTENKPNICFIDFVEIFPEDWEWSYFYISGYLPNLKVNSKGVDVWGDVADYFGLEAKEYNALFDGAEYYEIACIGNKSKVSVVIDHWQSILKKIL